MKKTLNLIRLNRGSLVVVASLMLILALSFSIGSGKAQGTRIVYVVICVDSDVGGGVNSYLGNNDPHPMLDVQNYFPGYYVSQVFDSGFRTSHQDSMGNAIKMTWFASNNYLIDQGVCVIPPSTPAGVSGYTAIHDLLINNWGEEIQQYGDSIENQHQFVIYDGTWKRYDNGPDSGYAGYHMDAIDHMIIDSNFYPSTWRSGWLIMPSVLSNWLEQWVPFDYTPNSGTWYPWHPSGMNRWQTRCSTLGPDPTEINSTFAGARDAGPYGRALYAVGCNDSDDLPAVIGSLQTYLTMADNDETTYPDVSFQYVTAREAVQMSLFQTDFNPPTFTVTPNGTTYTITSNEPLWMNHPYVALKYTNGTYVHIEATPIGTNKWKVTSSLSIPLEKIGVAASDLYGNPGVLVVEAPPKHLVTFSQNGLDASTTGKVVTVNGSAINYADLPYTMLVDNGTSISYSYEANVSSNINGKCHKLDTVSEPSSPIIVKNPMNITGNYVTQYYLTVTSPYDTPSGQGWYNASSSAYATLASGNVSGINGVRHVFTGWSGDASGTSLTSNQITMNGPKTATANWKTENVTNTENATQYYIIVNSAHGSPTPSALVNSGSTFTVSVTSPTEIVEGDHQWICTGFSIDGGANQTGSTYTFTNVQATHTIDFNWKQQIWVVFQQTGILEDSTAHVTVNSVQHTLPYSDWFDKGSSIDFTYETAVLGANDTINILASKSHESPLTVEDPTTVTGHYETEYTKDTNNYQYTTEMIAIISAIIIIAALAIATILLKRRKTKPV